MDVIASGGWEHCGSSQWLHSEQDYLSLLPAQTHCQDWVGVPDAARMSRVAKAETPRTWTFAVPLGEGDGCTHLAAPG